ncbi:glycoside hydrolase superfamily [Xylariaceae sp. FL1272]|nr:glycoside hydrolase superfamily [Xylariaceae sp. FL1272]
MGWNTWNVYKADINESALEAAINGIVRTGMQDVGYRYIIMDEGWSADERDANGNLQVNVTRFPTGVKYLADYAHKHGTKLGIYSDAGINTCGFKPGSYGYEQRDAALWASWDIDYLKYDNCGGFLGMTEGIQERFLAMAVALKNSGREVFFSMCEWGFQFPWWWADEIGQSYRMAGDIHGSFASDNSGLCKTAYCLNTGYAGTSVLTTIRKMREISRFQKPGSWADMDLLEIGNNFMSTTEEETHMAFWAALKSPLIASVNLDTISETSLDILMNKEIIAINQDELGVAINYIPGPSIEESIQIWAGPLSSAQSRFVILAFNEKNATQDISFRLSDIPGFYTAVQGNYTVRDVWSKRYLAGVTNNIKLPNVTAHETKVLSIKSAI